MGVSLGGSHFPMKKTGGLPGLFVVLFSFPVYYVCFAYVGCLYHLTPSRTIDYIRDVSFCPKMVKQHANKWLIVNELPLVLIHHTSNLRFWIYPLKKGIS